MRPSPRQPPARCLVCGVSDVHLRYRLTRFDVLVCRACEQIFLHPLPSEAEIEELFRRLYTTGKGSVPELESYYGFTYHDEPDNPVVAQYETYLDRIESLHPPGRLLDVGCGTGLFLAVARRRGWEPFGIDESREATDWAREHFGLDPWVGAFDDFVSRGERFDAITGWDVIEHARDPVALARAMRESLSPSGVVALSTPNQRSILDLVAGLLYGASLGRVVAPLEKFYIEQHFLYFTPESLGHCLDRAGLRMIHTERELTQLGRLSLAPWTRLALKGLFLIARIIQRENRLFTLARPIDAPST